MRRGSCRVCAFAALLLAAVPPMTAQDGPNLIRNGGFEDNAPGADVDYWMPTPSYPASAEVIEDPEGARSGNRYLRLTPAKPDTDGNLYQFIRKIPEAERYIASLQARGRGARARVFIYEYGDGLKFLGSQPSQSVELTDEWQQCAVEYTPRDGLRNLACAIHIAGGPADVDDVRVVAVGGTIPDEEREVAERPWRGNDLGLAPSVPAPFTPMEVVTTDDGEIAIHCWGREMVLGDGTLPERIGSQGRGLLSAPMRLTVRDAAGAHAPVDVHWRMEETRDDMVRAQGEGRLTERLTVRSSIAAEFDGFTRVDLELVPEQTAEVEALWVDIPLDAGQAEFVYRHTAPRQQYYGRAPAEDQAWPFSPTVWIGNHKRGLCWFAEAPRGWRIPDEARALQWLSGADQTVLRIRLIDLPTRLEEPATFTFGLLATPPKAPPGEVEQQHIRGGPSTPRHVKTVYLLLPFGRDPLRYHLGQEAVGNAERLIAATRGNAQKPVAWMQLGMMRPVAGYERYLEQWRRVPGRTYPPDFVYVCPGSEWADMLLYALAELQADFDLSGYYFDTGTLTPCKNAAHGCGYSATDGQWRASYPIFSVHEFKKRLYRVLEERLGADEAYISTLINANLDLPTLTFDAAAVSGEELSGRVTEDYTAAISAEHAEVQFDHHAWGLWHVWLPVAAASHGRAATDSFLALSLLHDTPLWIAYTDYDRVFEVLDALADFGTRQARFIPPWECGDVVSVEGGDCQIAIHAQTEKLLMVASNLTAEPQEVALSVEWPAAGPGAETASAEDALTGEAVEIEGRSLEFDVPAHSFRLLIVRTGPRGAEAP